MTTVKQWNLHAACFCMALLIVLGSFLNPQTISVPGSLPSYGSGSSDRMELPMVIKTQKAADKIPNGIKGIDVSQYQGTINWKSVANDDIKFAMVRASCGTSTDKKFKVNAQNAHKSGISVGAYHYATFSSTEEAKKEAKYFIKLLKSIQVTYPVVLDLEENKATRKVSKSKLTTAGLAFMDAIKQEGYQVMLYSNENFFLSHIDSKAVQKKGYDIWAANYIEKPTKVPHKIWQYTSYGQVDGISGRVDMNIAYKDLAAGKKLSVDKTVSDSIKTWLNDNYNADLASDQLDMKQVKAALVTGLQEELNSQFDTELDVNGELNADTTDCLDSLSFESDEQNNLIYIIQAALFYKGCYTGTPTGVWDEKTVKATEKYQSEQNLKGSGELNQKTLVRLFK